MGGGCARVGERHQTLAIAIVAVILLSAAPAYMRELQAERATDALRDLLLPHARRRDGTELDVSP